jgi:hypothetical protein
MRGLNVAILPGADGGLSVVGDIVVTARRDEAETNVLVRQASTSDRTGLSLREQPRNTQVISAKTIEEQQGLSVVDALQNAGGVTAQANNYAGNPSYTVRGFYAAGLVNGLPGGAAQPIANVERVEILKGPDAILSGFGSLGGNINVVTKKPSAEERLTASMDAGSLGLVRGVIDANNAINADKTLSGRVVASALSGRQELAVRAVAALQGPADRHFRQCQPGQRDQRPSRLYLVRQQDPPAGRSRSQRADLPAGSGHLDRLPTLLHRCHAADRSGPRIRHARLAREPERHGVHRLSRL